MTVAKLTIIGQIKGVKYRTAGETPVCELSVCKKRYAKQEEPSYDWFRVNVWGKLPDFMAKKIAKDNFIGACGDFSTRDWTNAQGEKKTQMEVKCQSFDVEIDGPHVAEEQSAAPAPAPRRPAAPSGGGSDDDSSPPFMRRCEWE